MDKPLTPQELLEIASAVSRGERPESDLAKYGISIGAPVSGDFAKQMLLTELEELETKENNG